MNNIVTVSIEFKEILRIFLKRSLLYLLFLFFSSNLFAQNQSEQIQLTSTDAILDLESSDKGILVPRMTTQQRNAILSPTTGLLVFDSDTKSFWFQDGNSEVGSLGWTELVAGSRDDSDADPSNEIQQLSTNKDTIFISGAGYIIIPGLGNVSLLPDCNDHQMTGTETGVDCGGPFCVSCTERCSDGILNGDEEAVDCGGASCDPCPTCDDGIKNGTELFVDCGGPDCPECSLLDIIIIVDNSGDMLSEMQQIQNNLNNFAAILENNGLNWRIILISDYPSICVPAPLGGATCPAGGPINTSNFYHYSSTISSLNSLCKILDSYSTPDEFNLAPNGWQNWLRMGSLKVFIEVSTDGVSCNSYNDGDSELGGIQVATAFNTALATLSSADFGTIENPQYIFYGILGIPLSSPLTPMDTIVLNTCITGVEPGTGYQALAINTGGLRYSTCSLDYVLIFNDLASHLITLLTPSN